jgi:hypothetical protein
MTEPDPATRDQISDLLGRLSDAERSGDADTLAALLDEDFTCVGPLGFVLDKSRWLASARTADLRYQVLTLEESAARQYGDTVITISVRTQEGTYQGHPTPGSRFRVSHILVRRDVHWLVAGFQLTAIAAPPGR